MGCKSHQHTLGDYTYDAYLHWQECMDCHEKVNHVYHTYGTWKIEKEPTETEEGLRRQTCSACGFPKQKQFLLQLISMFMEHGNLKCYHPYQILVK